jgi:alpha-beta hydrolase superfamily lysophospholipase
MRQTAVEISTVDGLRLRGVFERPDGESRAAVLFLHGLNETRDEDRDSRAGIPPFIELANALVAESISCLRFDFRGHGDSDARLEDMTFAGERLDAAAALEDLRLREPRKPIGLVAASFGAVAALPLLKASAVTCGVLWNPLIDVRGTFVEPVLPWPLETFGPDGVKGHERIELGDGRAFGPGLLAEMLAYERVDPASVSAPILVCHGTEDTYLEFGESKAFAAAAPRGEFVAISGAGHGFGAAADRRILIPATTAWLAQRLRLDARHD